MNDNTLLLFKYSATLYAAELQLLCAGAFLLLIGMIVLMRILHKSRRKNRKLEQLVAQLQLSQQQLQASERSAKEFIANVSHEIHASLSAIQSFADMVQQQDLALQQRIQYAKVISGEAGQLSALSNQLLLLSRLENEEKAMVKRQYSIKAQLRQVLELYEYQMAGKSIMSILKASEESLIYGDQVLLLQVWSNLLSNAIKHTRAEGSVTIEASCNEQYCKVTVSDTGEGIAQETIPHIFERFYWRKRKNSEEISGNGLGLSIVNKIVHLHAGTIHLTSEIGKGTTVAICLPQSLP